MDTERSILIVEDDDFLREGIVELFESDGWSVHQAENGAAGLRTFRSQPIEVVLTDLRMPNMDGIQLIHQLREIDPEVPLVVLTAFGTVERLRDALRAGANDFMHKPFDNDVLLDTMQKAYIGRARGSLPERVLERSSCVLNFDIEADTALIAGVAAEVDMLARHLGFYRKRWLIRRAVEEALENAIVHGAGSDLARRVHIRAEFLPAELHLRIEDPGPGFDPASKLNEGIQMNQRLEKGIFLLKSFCDELTWEGSGNIVSLVFYRPSTIL